MNIADFLALAQDFSDLGWSVQDQFRDVVVNGQELEDQNTNALNRVRPILQGLVSENVDGAERWLETFDAYLGDAS